MTSDKQPSVLVVVESPWECASLVRQGVYAADALGTRLHALAIPRPQNLTPFHEFVEAYAPYWQEEAAEAIESRLESLSDTVPREFTWSVDRTWSAATISQAAATRNAAVVIMGHRGQLSRLRRLSSFIERSLVTSVRRTNPPWELVLVPLGKVTWRSKIALGTEL